MALQSSNILLDGDVFSYIRGATASWKAQAQNASTAMAVGTIDTNFVFQMLDVLNQIITSLTTWSETSGLNAYATSQGYPTTLTTDCNAVITAAQNCVNWVVSNFPVDSNGYLQGYKLNSNGSRTAATFTSTQTSSLQTLLNTLASTIT